MNVKKSGGQILEYRSFILAL